MKPRRTTIATVYIYIYTRIVHLYVCIFILPFHAPYSEYNSKSVKQIQKKRLLLVFNFRRSRSHGYISVCKHSINYNLEAAAWFSAVVSPTATWKNVSLHKHHFLFMSKYIVNGFVCAAFVIDIFFDRN